MCLHIFDAMQQPIRILMLFTILNRGGAETIAMNYYRNMDRSKVQFDFMVHRPERGAYEDEIEQLGGKIYRMLPVHPLYFKEYQKQISRFFDEHPEYRIIHGHCSELGYFVYKEAAKRNIPVIIAHAHLSSAFIDIKWPFRMFFKYGMRKYINQYFACSKDAAKWLFGKKLEKKAVIQNNAIEPTNFAFSAETRKQVRKQWGIPEDTLVLGHVGRMDKQKNHRFILDIFEAYHQKHSNSKLMLVGDGELYPSIQKEVERKGLTEQVMLLGTRSDVPQLMQAMDVFLFPSYFEGLGVVLIEAQAASLPCLVSDRIPKEAFITDLIQAKSLDAKVSEWVEGIEALLVHERKADDAERIKEKGYSIQEQAEWLQNYYLNLSRIP